MSKNNINCENKLILIFAANVLSYFYLQQKWPFYHVLYFIIFNNT